MGFWDDKKPKKESFVTKEDLAKMQRDMEKLLKDKDQPDTGGATSKLVKGMRKGFGDVAKSLATPQSSRRMRIAQMPGSKPPIVRTKVSNPIAGRNAGMRHRHISDAPLD